MLYILKRNGSTIQSETVDSPAIFSGLTPGPYTVTAYKNKVFGPTTKPATITNADTTVSFP